MSTSFSDTSGSTGILQQVRKLMRVDANQWPTVNVVNSCNHYMDTVTGYAIGADRRFQWDNTNHAKLPIGTTNLVVNQSDYSFLTDEQNNNILSLTRIDMLLNETTDTWTTLSLIDQNNPLFNGVGLQQAFSSTGTPQYYDKIADNIIRLYPTPEYSKTSGLKFYFQRTSPYFDVADTTETTGFAPLLDRGFIIAAAYDGALTLGLQNLQPLSVEMQREEKKMIEYFAIRNRDADNVMRPKRIMYI